MDWFAEGPVVEAVQLVLYYHTLLENGARTPSIIEFSRSLQTLLYPNPVFCQLRSHLHTCRTAIPDTSRSPFGKCHTA